MNGWIKYTSSTPTQNAKVLYYNSAIGIHSGIYRTAEEVPGFYGEAGYMAGNEVTHWQYDTGGESKQAPIAETKLAEDIASATSQNELLSEMREGILEVISTYEGRTTFISVLGVLEIVKAQLLLGET